MTYTCKGGREGEGGKGGREGGREVGKGIGKEGGREAGGAYQQEKSVKMR